MKRSFIARRVLRLVSNTLWQRYFASFGELLDLPWSEMKGPDVEALFEAWHKLPEPRRSEVGLLLKDLNIVHSPQGLQVVSELAHTRLFEGLDEFDALEGGANRGLWLKMRAPSLFDLATRLARADEFENTRHWKPSKVSSKLDLDVNLHMRITLGSHLSEFFVRTQGRGHHCRVEHDKRTDNLHYFFAYISDYPDRKQVFRSCGTLDVLSDPNAFDVVFVYDACEGTLSSYVRGGQKVWQALHRIFCEIVLGEAQVGVQHQSPYELNHLLDPSFDFGTHAADCVRGVTVRTLRISPKAGGKHSMTFHADPNSGRDAVYGFVNSFLMGSSWGTDAVNVTLVSIAIEYADGDKARSFTFDITRSSCTLKSNEDERQRRMGERYLREWGIDVA